MRASAPQDARQSVIKKAQVDSIRVLALPDGKPVKCIEYDSFGNVLADTQPGWQFPLGFACGLNDPWTGFVRFAFRDYDPRFGRFTARARQRSARICLQILALIFAVGGLCPPLSGKDQS